MEICKAINEILSLYLIKPKNMIIKWMDFITSAAKDVKIVYFAINVTIEA